MQAFGTGLGQFGYNMFSKYTESEYKIYLKKLPTYFSISSKPSRDSQLSIMARHADIHTFTYPYYNYILHRKFYRI